VNPFLPFKPKLPGILVLHNKLSSHFASLSAFLNSLPAPFKWIIQSNSEAEELADEVFERHRGSFDVFLDKAEQSKSRGNAAYKSNTRVEALAMYDEAMEFMTMACSRLLEKDEEQKAMRQLAIIQTNMAATHLLPGKGQNTLKAYSCARRAEDYDPSYPKW
jgi:hypothetical protein